MTMTQALQIWEQGLHDAETAKTPQRYTAILVLACKAYEDARQQAANDAKVKTPWNK